MPSVKKEVLGSCREIFRDVLQGARLIANKSMWRQFPVYGATNGKRGGMDFIQYNACWEMTRSRHLPPSSRRSSKSTR